MADYDLIIIGSGPAGMTASIYAARANLSVLMLDKLAPGGQIINTNEIQNYTGTARNWRFRCFSILRSCRWLSIIRP